MEIVLGGVKYAPFEEDYWTLTRKILTNIDIGKKRSMQIIQ